MSSTNNEERPPSDLTVLDDETPSVAVASTTTTTTTTTTTEPVSKKSAHSPQTTPIGTLPQEIEGTTNNDEEQETHPEVPTSTDVDTTEETTIPSEEVQQTSTPVAAVATTTPPVTTTPLTPPAPTSEREVKLAILTEAFPTVEKEVCEFVLESHRGNVEASINALLEISDPDFQPESQPPVVEAIPAAPPALPRRQSNNVTQDFSNMNLGQDQARDIDPILLASTSTSEQQLRADEDFARTLAAMDEYRARDRQNNQQGQRQQQQYREDEEEGPSFATEIKELMDEELPKIKERFNVAADTTKKKVTEWYNVIKAKAEAAQAQRNANQGSSSQDRQNPIVFDNRLDEDEPLARHRVTPPLSNDTASPPLPARPYTLGDDSAGEELSTTNGRRTTVEDGA
ncbi:ubiquitin-binding protein cue5 [Haplosporangium sp. Z 27]|nr:ubiquitin-binding protein cue5 [Haplosporangium sp. Z 27]